jgi:8-oxo-dGTP pyrophosphatase MutT (NUDIX family)
LPKKVGNFSGYSLFPSFLIILMIEQLRQRLQLPLPGTKAQFEMRNGQYEPHVLRDFYQNLPPSHRKAAVTVLLFQRQGQWHTALMQRPADSHAHSNEVSLPGGRHDETDPHILFTAQRELEEEFGVKPHQVEILGALSPLYIPISNIYLSPFVGYAAESDIKFAPDPKEVVEVLETPISWLLDPARRKTTNIQHGELEMPNVPYFDFHQRVVWGATAMIINEFIACLSE